MQAWLRSRNSQSKEAPWQWSIPQNHIPQNSDALSQRRTLQGPWSLLSHASHWKGTEEARWEHSQKGPTTHIQRQQTHLSEAHTDGKWQLKIKTVHMLKQMSVTTFPSLSCSDAFVRCLVFSHDINLGHTGLHIPQRCTINPSLTRYHQTHQKINQIFFNKNIWRR